MSKRGYFGVVVERPKFIENIGIVWRSAHCFEAAFLGVIGARFEYHAANTTKAERHIPFWQWSSGEAFLACRPERCDLIGVELTDDAVRLEGFAHPERAIYLLGPEDGNLSDTLRAQCAAVVRIETKFCLNVATAGAVVMYDRHLKAEADPTEDELAALGEGP